MEENVSRSETDMGMGLEEEDISGAEFAIVLQNIEGYETVNSESTAQWFDIDSNTLGYEVLSDAEIVRKAWKQAIEADDRKNGTQSTPEKNISNTSIVELIEGWLEYWEQQNYKLISDKLRKAIRKES